MFPLSLAISSLLFIQNQHLAASVFIAFSVISGTVLLYVLSIRLIINLVSFCFIVGNTVSGFWLGQEQGFWKIWIVKWEEIQHDRNDPDY